jgi:hypothetical protein
MLGAYAVKLSGFGTALFKVLDEGTLLHEADCALSTLGIGLEVLGPAAGRTALALGLAGLFAAGDRAAILTPGGSFEVVLREDGEWEDAETGDTYEVTLTENL